jgi:hypothetical protein
MMGAGSEASGGATGEVDSGVSGTGTTSGTTSAGEEDGAGESAVMEATTDSPLPSSPPTGEGTEEAEALSVTASAGWSIAGTAVTSDPGEVSWTSEFSIVDGFGIARTQSQIVNGINKSASTLSQPVSQQNHIALLIRTPEAGAVIT